MLATKIDRAVLLRNTDITVRSVAIKVLDKLALEGYDSEVIDEWLQRVALTGFCTMPLKSVTDVVELLLEPYGLIYLTGFPRSWSGSIAQFNQLFIQAWKSLYQNI
jgi:hypothetical protein